MNRRGFFGRVLGAAAAAVAAPLVAQTPAPPVPLTPSGEFKYPTDWTVQRDSRGQSRGRYYRYDEFGRRNVVDVVSYDDNGAVVYRGYLMLPR